MSAGNDSDQRYNGWTNYPTWCINLWLANDEGLYNLTREQAREALGEYSREGAVDSLEEWLHDELCEVGGDYGLIPDLEGFPGDLMGWALGHVDWREVAEAWIKDEIDG